MSKIALSGNASGTGTLTIAAPNTSTDRTLTLPDNTGTILTNATAGTVLQVVSATYSTYTTVASTSFTDSGLTATITPTSSNSKILILLNPAIGVYRQTNASAHGSMNIVRGSTQITQLDGPSISSGVDASGFIVLSAAGCFIYLDSPSTTSSTTYKMQMRINTTANSGTVRLNNYITSTGDTKSSITLMEIAA